MKSNSHRGAQASIPSQVHQLSSTPHSEQRVGNCKRSREADTDHAPHEEPLCKKPFLSHTPPSPNTGESDIKENPHGASVFWQDYYGQWPPILSQQARTMRNFRPTKRTYTPSRSNSYSQSVRDGGSPAPWTWQDEENMQEAGLIMTEDRSRVTITDDCRELFDRLVKAEYSVPDGLFEPDRFSKVLAKARLRNKARIIRDVTPLLVPSPELLHIDGQPGLKNMCEAMNAEWTQCDTLYGPRPKPDFVVGISASAFTEEEKDKLRISHTSASPNLFPENMYFPFLICEVKDSDGLLRGAERQTMYSASLAIRALIQLYRKISATKEVDRQILAISIVHNDSDVKIFGHFAAIEGEEITFFRHKLYATDFTRGLSSDNSRGSYRITRAIYEDFFPRHLARITSALARLRSPSLASFTDQLGLEEDSTPGQSSLQEDGIFKKPSLPSTARLQQEKDRLHDQLLEVMREHQEEARRQREDQQSITERQLAQQKEQMERQLAQQKEESREQKERMERQLAQQKEDSREQKEQMERQLAQQKEESRERKDLMERQLAQQCDIIELLKKSMST